VTLTVPALPIPWTAGKAVRRGEDGRPDHDGDTTLVQVSRLELARRRDVPGFLVAALRIRRLALRTPGCIGLALRAQPFRRTFWTLSAWDDQAAIGAFMRSDGHRAVMVEYRGRMAGSHFHTWNAGEGTARPTWTDARRRYDESLNGRPPRAAVAEH
jgi:heme-degrading monooxygenase HmoA